MNKSITVAAVILFFIIAFGTGLYLSQDRGMNQNSQSTSVPVSTSKSLDMSGKQLTEVPVDVLNQTEITSLNLSNNQLTTLPSGIQKLQNLEILNIENNRLVSLPPEIGQLQKLKTLDLSNNRLESLPPELGNLTQLKTLNLGNYKGPQSDIEQLRTKLPNTEIRI